MFAHLVCHGHATRGCRHVSRGSDPFFDNRELAIVIWIAIALVYALTQKDVRSSLWSILKMASGPKIAIPLASMIVYVGVIVAALRRADIWTAELGSETLFWFVGTAVVSFLSYERVSQDPRFFRRTALGVLSVTALIEFLSNLYTFNLEVELLLVLAFFALGAVLAVAQTKAEYRQVRGCLQAILAAVGLGLLAYAVMRTIRSPSTFATTTNARKLAVPIVMTICLLPFLYGLAVYGNYDSLLTRLRLQLRDERDLYRYLRRRLVRTTRVRLRAVLRAQAVPWTMMLSRPSNRTEVDRALECIRTKRPLALATSPSADERLQTIEAAQDPGWEYTLFAARLDIGATATAMSSSGVDDQGRTFNRPLKSLPKVITLLKEDRERAIELVARLGNVLEQDRVAQAFGAPGSPGNPNLIVELAEDLIVTYADMLKWSVSAKPTKTSERFAHLVRLHSELLDQPIDQIDAYIERWNDFTDQLPDLIAQSQDVPIDQDMSLVITVDDDVLSRFVAEVDRLRGT